MLALPALCSADLMLRSEVTPIQDIAILYRMPSSPPDPGVCVRHESLSTYFWSDDVSRVVMM